MTTATRASGQAWRSVARAGANRIRSPSVSSFRIRTVRGRAFTAASVAFMPNAACRGGGRTGQGKRDVGASRPGNGLQLHLDEAAGASARVGRGKRKIIRRF